MKKRTIILLILAALLVGCGRESACQSTEDANVTMTVDWDWLYGKLPTGHYRILKQAGAEVISAEFTVE